MKKATIIIYSLILLLGIIAGGCYVYKYNHRTFANPTELLGISNLDHDIYAPNLTKICDEQKTGFDTWVGPTGWPWTDPVMWEVALFEDTNNYYARLIFHEYMLWWSWDDPYIVCKFPKSNVDGDLRTNEKLRWQVLWDITHTTERSYDYKPYMPNAIVQKINGHTVTLGTFYGCKYEKYFVICDESSKW